MLRRLCGQATRRRRLPFSPQQVLAPPNAAREPTFVIGSGSIWNILEHTDPDTTGNVSRRSTRDALLPTSPSSKIIKSIFIMCSIRPSTSLDGSCVHHASLRRTVRTYATFRNVKAQKSGVKKEASQECASSQPENQEEMVDMDASLVVARALQEARQGMMLHMRRCAYALFAVGAVHLSWGGLMFFTLETPLNHAVMAEVCMSSIVICGLAYQLKQAIKPIQFFTDLKEYQQMRALFLSCQITRMLGAFFHRGYGIAFVLSLTLGAHSLTCIRFLL